MNERIRELALQARNDFVNSMAHPEEYTGMYDGLMEKFAELILANHAELTRSADPINKPFELNPKFVAKCDEIGRSRRQFQ